jgi:hypothetical protein
LDNYREITLSSNVHVQNDRGESYVLSEL